MTESAGFARAKINLFLDAVGKRADGYHLIDGVMQSVGICDEIKVTRTDEKGISLCVRNAPDVPSDRRNLVWRATELFLEKSGLSFGVRIELRKNIPSAGGLAGGSSDGACVLKLLNELAGDKALSDTDLSVLALQLGADVPFCLLSPHGAMRTGGIGEKLSVVPSLPHCYILIANAGEGVPTPWGYGMLDRTVGDFSEGLENRQRRLENLIAGLREKNLEKITANCYNIFESAVEPLRPFVTDLKAKMMRSGAMLSLMSGSGASVFGIYEDKNTADRLCEKLQKDGVTAFVTEPENRT